MKKIFMVLAATLICGASVFTSCKKDEDNNLKLEEKIIGKWMIADRDGQAALTNEKSVLTVLSATEALLSTSRDNYSSTSSKWYAHLECSVAIDGNRVTITGHPNEHSTLIHELNIHSITTTKMEVTFKHITKRDGEVIATNGPMEMRWVKITTDYEQAILGTWQGHCTSEGSVFDDGQEHRWQYNADGNFVYYVKDGDNWVPSANTLNQYFVDGNLLCTRWVDNGEEHREWWEIAIDGSQMHWTALREDENGQRFTATFQMSKLN